MYSSNFQTPNSDRRPETAEQHRDDIAKVVGPLAYQRFAAASEVARRLEQYFKADDVEIATEVVSEYLTANPPVLIMEGKAKFTKQSRKTAVWQAGLVVENDRLEMVRLSISVGNRFVDLPGFSE